MLGRRSGGGFKNKAIGTAQLVHDGRQRTGSCGLNWRLLIPVPETRNAAACSAAAPAMFILNLPTGRAAAQQPRHIECLLRSQIRGPDDAAVKGYVDPSRGRHPGA